MNFRSAFTLIELSIVLVTIGMLIGGVVMGRDLIEVAKIRSELSQIDQFRVAEDVFRNRYGDIPGDISSAKAERLNLIHRWGSYAVESDGKISGATAMTTGRTGYFGPAEHHIYFLQLSGLQCPEGIGHPMQGARLLSIQLDIRAIYGSGGTTCNLRQNPNIGPGITLPRSKLNPEFSIMPVTAIPFSMTTWYILNAKAADGWSGVEEPSLTPLQAFQLDGKIDDGVPATGMVRAYQYGSIHTDFGYNDRYIEIDNYAGDCVVDAAATRYNVTDPELLCAIIVRK